MHILKCLCRLQQSIPLELGSASARIHEHIQYFSTKISNKISCLANHRKGLFCGLSISEVYLNLNALGDAVAPSSTEYSVIRLFAWSVQSSHFIEALVFAL